AKVRDSAGFFSTHQQPASIFCEKISLLVVLTCQTHHIFANELNLRERKSVVDTVECRLFRGVL
ncbi:MAG TPA: hypothetical protein VN114_04255, partial [Oxalicibacterium sp.]|uniref:hypothetical protein n=1 Tax=Oxalicibacterium sp. TaxID=2766525 RepID=UPI002C540A45